MAYPYQFIKTSNFQLAFDRLKRGSNKDFKRFYRHIIPSFELALNENIHDIISDLKRGTYKPSAPNVVYQPKKNGILRPISLLSIRDLVVYQAITNIVASSFSKEHEKVALTKSFGHILAGKSSKFLYKSWRVCYGEYSKRIARSFNAGNTYLADFDLVSFYEIIDHHQLRACLEEKVASKELLDLLFKCLEAWTSSATGAHLHHGIPQGPEASAFLAECFLLHFDRKKFPRIDYFRYVDDIKLMSSDEVRLRRALLQLDLYSKELGLVPQAQKIEIRKVASIEEILKTIPSRVACV